MQIPYVFLLKALIELQQRYGLFFTIQSVFAIILWGGVVILLSISSLGAVAVCKAEKSQNLTFKTRPDAAVAGIIM